MKIRSSIIFLCAIVLILAALTIWFGKKPTESHLSSTTETNMEQAVTKSNQPTTPIVKINATATMATNSSIRKTSKYDKDGQMREGLATLNDVPILFYGRLEDQFGDPVAGAQISGVTVIRNGTKSGAERVSTVSDGNGFFQLNAGKGESLGVTPHKKGYGLATTDTSFDYSYLYADHFTPDQNNPTVIKMWKLQGAEPLVGINQHYKLHYTNAPISFDLLAGKIVTSGGDIQLTVNRAAGVISGRNRLNWSVQVAAVNGGVMDSGGQEGVTYAAPEDGYQPSIVFMFSTNAPYKWFGGFDQGFFVMSRNGQVYSKVGLGFNINDAPDGFMSITFGGVASTNGSRNWEATVPQ